MEFALVFEELLVGGLQGVLLGKDLTLLGLDAVVVVVPVRILEVYHLQDDQHSLSHLPRLLRIHALA